MYICREAMKQAREAKLVGIAVSTLGRQASKTTLRQIEGLLAECGVDYITVLMDDVSPVTLAKFTDVEAWIQMACPRLSLDWASGFSTPILTTHEAIQTFDPSNSKQEWTSVPMDNWASGPNHYRQN